jgi:hypothetical protein
MRKEMMLLAALLVAAAIGVAKPAPTLAAAHAAPAVLCPLCPPGWTSSGPPLCRCMRNDGGGND